MSTYPYRAAGKLFLRNPANGATVFCSAAVINKRLLGTAGHCVYDTAANRFYDNFRFVPAYNNGSAPYGSWDWQWVWAANTWINSVGSAPFPNNGDFAILEVQDENVAGATRKIGDHVGFLGWVTNGLVGQNITTLGYPLNLDNGQRMQITNSEARAVSGANAGQIGNDQTGGSSGGPWMRDFGVSGNGNPTTAANRNRIVGYTSYGPTQFGPRYQGATVLNQEWVNMYNQACARRSGNC
ncbi:MAG: trypsin-like serine protease [Geminicoccaceae bacterium]